MPDATTISTSKSLSDLTKTPEQVVDFTGTERWSFDRAELEAFQLAALKHRFETLRSTIPVVNRFADEQKLEEIKTLEDGALMLLPHTVYKSYPLSVFEKGRYEVLTKWLQTLTSIDLSNVDASKCDSIDSWIDVLDANSEIRVRHSSGTTGKLSFVPMTEAESYWNSMSFKRHFEGFGDEPDSVIEGFHEMPLIGFSQAFGAAGAARTMQTHKKYLYGGRDDMTFAIFPGRMSADVLSLAGRLAGAQAKGERGKLELSPSLIARRDQFVKEQEEAPKRLRERLGEMVERFRGKRVTVKGVTPIVVDVATTAIDQGIEQLFAANSLVSYMGGSKGRSLPDDYQERMVRFTGVALPPTGYGMSESVSNLTRMCPSGNYHVQPTVIPYLLDPKTGELLPRTGTVTGRYGMFDLAMLTRWGGYLTGDEVTIHWGDDKPCKCGRKGAYFGPNIRRYSEAEGGDDKITCAGTPEVHDKALDFIARAVG